MEAARPRHAEQQAEHKVAADGEREAKRHGPDGAVMGGVDTSGYDEDSQLVDMGEAPGAGWSCKDKVGSVADGRRGAGSKLLEKGPRRRRELVRTGAAAMSGVDNACLCGETLEARDTGALDWRVRQGRR